MSFETEGQETAKKIATAITLVITYGLGMLALVWGVHWFGPQRLPPECVCRCEAKP